MIEEREALEKFDALAIDICSAMAAPRHTAPCCVAAIPACLLGAPATRPLHQRWFGRRGAAQSFDRLLDMAQTEERRQWAAWREYKRRVESQYMSGRRKRAPRWCCC